MSRVVALIDGEHYPPVVRYALAALGGEYEVAAAAFLGGTEKVDLDAGMATYGVPIVVAQTGRQALAEAIERYHPDVIVDLSDEPVVSSPERMVLASLALANGVAYRGADFSFQPPRSRFTPCTPSLALIGTGKRVGKTAVSAYVARRLKAAGSNVVVLAMGRGGPNEPELIHGDQVELRTPDLLELARQGKHAASDNYEDAVMSRVTTVGCRRCGGGMAGETFFSNVPEGARLADSLGKDLLMLEGSGAAIPPVHADANILVVGGGRGVEYVSDFFGPYRLSLADLVIVTSAEEPVATPEDISRLKAAIAEQRPDVPVVTTTFRPAPVEPVAGKRVFFATTAPEPVVRHLSAFLEREFACTVVGTSANLSNRRLLREDVARCAGQYDLLLTELKAAAIDVVAAAGEDAGVPVVLCDNVPVALDGQDLGVLVEAAARKAMERGRARKGHC